MAFESEQRSVSAIIITYNSSQNIIKALTAIKREVDSVGGEIILYDNNSSDETLKIIENNFGNIDIIKSNANIGFGRANNRAVKKASGKYILFANPDMIPDSGMLDKMIEAAESLDNAGAVVGRMRNEDNSFQPTCRQLPTLSNIFLSRGSLLGKLFGKKSSYTLRYYDEITAVPSVSATCMLIEKKIFLEIGGFDERYFMFMEDTDLSVAIGENGRKIYFVPTAGAIHLWGKGSKTSLSKRLFHQHRSVHKYYLKHYPGGFSLFILPLILLVNLTVRVVFGTNRNR